MIWDEDLADRGYRPYPSDKDREVCPTVWMKTVDKRYCIRFYRYVFDHTQLSIREMWSAELSLYPEVGGVDKSCRDGIWVVLGFHGLERRKEVDVIKCVEDMAEMAYKGLGCVPDPHNQ